MQFGAFKEKSCNNASRYSKSFFCTMVRNSGWTRKLRLPSSSQSLLLTSSEQPEEVGDHEAGED